MGFENIVHIWEKLKEKFTQAIQVGNCIKNWFLTDTLKMYKPKGTPQHSPQEVITKGSPGCG